MKKKLYIKPMIENIKMLEESSILAASGDQPATGFDASVNGRSATVDDDMDL
jgi:hypothetical protein